MKEIGRSNELVGRDIQDRRWEGVKGKEVGDFLGEWILVKISLTYLEMVLQ